jgi:hypothetical protein
MYIITSDIRLICRVNPVLYEERVNNKQCEAMKMKVRGYKDCFCTE